MTIVSCSMPTTSVMCVTLRGPPCRRLACTIRSTALAICVPHGLQRQLEAGHHDHGFQPGEGVARRVGVQRGHRAFVAGVHGLEHVERLGAAALADDDPLGPHTQGVAHQVGGRDRALAFDVRPAGFPAAPRGPAAAAVRPRPRWSRCGRCSGMKLDSVFSSVVLPEPVPPEMTMFSRALIAPSRSITISGVNALKFSRSSSFSGLAPKRRMETHGAVQRQRRNDRVETRAVGHAGVDHRAGLVHAAADLRDDPVDDLHQVVVVAERRRWSSPSCRGVRT